MKEGNSETSNFETGYGKRFFELQLPGLTPKNMGHNL